MSEMLANVEKLGSIDYSTSEQWTGKYWIDGKKIYQKTITISNTIKNSWNVQNHNIIGLSTVISCDGILLSNNSQDEQFILGGYRQNNVFSQLVINSSQAAIFLSDSSDFNGKTVYITIEYTKTTD